MDTSQIVSWHVKVFKANGLWPPKSNSIPYNIWAIMVAIFLYFIYSLFKLSSVLFVSSVDDFIRILLLASAVITISAKAFIVWLNNDTFVELIDFMEDMDGIIHFSEYQRFLEPLIKKSRLSLKCLIGFAITSYILLIQQLMTTPPEEKIYLSTYYYPYESLRQPKIYVGGLIYEAVANFLIIPVFVVLNLYGVMMMCILVGYINILCEKLRSFGNDSSKNHKSELVDICAMYISISRYRDLLETLLSASLFVEFGISSIILCSCSYQLTKIDISENPTLFVFLLTFVFEMLFAISIPSYFGSYVFEEGERIPYCVFQSNWIELNKDIKQSIGILMVRTMKPIQITSAKFFVLNLTTMIKILKVTYSLLAVLNSMD